MITKHKTSQRQMLQVKALKRTTEKERGERTSLLALSEGQTKAEAMKDQKIER